MAKTLIVVYKDEMVANQLRKMIETKDDISDKDIVGTKDDSINIVVWTEKVWLQNKKAGNIKDKVLFLGDIKGTDKLIPVLDKKIDEYGVKFGWAGNQAVLYTDDSVISDREKYMQLIEQLSELPVPDMIKKPKNVKKSETEKSSDEGEEIIDPATEQGKKTIALFDKAKNVVGNGADTLGKLGNRLAIKAEDTFRDRGAVRQQMLFYGVVRLYNNCLEEFMNI